MPVRVEEVELGGNRVLEQTHNSKFVRSTFKKGHKLLSKIVRLLPRTTRPPPPQTLTEKIQLKYLLNQMFILEGVNPFFLGGGTKTVVASLAVSVEESFDIYRIRDDEHWRLPGGPQVNYAARLFSGNMLLDTLLKKGWLNLNSFLHTG